jgi:c-di-GMP-binding flagellar brake protein YcgR
MESYNKGTIEQRTFERLVATLQIKYYVVDDKYAEQLKTEAAYKDTTMEQLMAVQRPSTVLQGVTENISSGGLSLVSEVPMAMGTHVVCDITMPNLPRPLRALAEVVRTDSKDGRIVDRTAQTYKVGLKIIAINKDDLTRIENFIIEEKIKHRLSGR